MGWLRSLTWDTYAYPEHLFNAEKCPQTIFVPETPILNKMIETVAKIGDKRLILAKFSDFALPMPQWMCEARRVRREAEKAERQIVKAARIAMGEIIKEDTEELESDQGTSNYE